MVICPPLVLQPPPLHDILVRCERIEGPSPSNRFFPPLSFCTSVSPLSIFAPQSVQQCVTSVRFCAAGFPFCSFSYRIIKTNSSDTPVLLCFTNASISLYQIVNIVPPSQLVVAVSSTEFTGHSAPQFRDNIIFTILGEGRPPPN